VVEEACKVTGSSSWRHAIWPLVAVVVLGVLLGVVLYTQDKDNEEARPTIEPLWKCSRQDISRIAGRFEDGDTIALERTKEEYRMAEPRQLPADQEDASTIFSWFTEPEPKRIVAREAGERLGDFGLDDPYGVVTVEFTADSKKELVIGDSSPVAEGELPDRYLKEGDSDTVYLFSGAVFKLLNRSVDEWRDRDVLRLDADTVERIEIWHDEESPNNFSARKPDAAAPFEWLIETDRYTAPADPTALKKLIGGFDRLKAEDFIDDDPVELAEYGLDPGYMKVSFVQADGEQTVNFGSFADKKGLKMYAKNNRWPYVFTVGTGVFGEVNPVPFNLLQTKPLAAVDYDRVAQIRWHPTDGAELQLSRRSMEKSVEQSKWGLQRSGSEDELDGKPVFDVLHALRALNATNVQPATTPAEYGQEAPVGSITITLAGEDGGDATELTLVVGSSLEEDKPRYVALMGYDLYYAVSDKAVAEALKALEELGR
jgi:hypothetical protein